jgi:hypothetical protein
MLIPMAEYSVIIGSWDWGLEVVMESTIYITIFSIVLPAFTNGRHTAKMGLNMLVILLIYSCEIE